MGVEQLGELRAKLKECEGFARQIPQLQKEIAELEADLEASAFHNDDGSSSPKRALPEAPIARVEAAQPLDGDEKQKRMRAINKKLQQIEKIKEQGGELDADMIAKVRNEPKLLKELQCLKNGDAYESDGETAPVAIAALPTDPEGIEKRIKAISKKLEQIVALKAKKGEGVVDAEAKAKIEGEHQLKQELAALQRGDTKVVFKEPSLDEVLAKQTAEKHELERKHKAIKKKLTSIDSLKKQDAGSLDADGKAKIAAEKDLKKDLSNVEKKMSEINKQERARVEARLG